MAAGESQARSGHGALYLLWLYLLWLCLLWLYLLWPYLLWLYLLWQAAASTSARALLTMAIARACVRLLMHDNMHMGCHDMCMPCVCLVPERGFLARIEDDRIAEIDAASGHEAYAESERASWAHHRHPSGECPFDVWAWKVATFGWNWC